MAKKAKIQCVGVMARTQVGGSCGIHAVLGCIQECLRLNSVSVICVPSLQDVTCCCKSNGNTIKGWTLSEVLTYILTHRLALEDNYPFIGDNVPCRRCKPLSKQIIIQPRIQITGFHHSGVVSAQQLSKFLSQQGHPICITLCVGDEFGGVDSQPDTDEDDLFVHVHSAPNEELGIYAHAIMIVDSGKIKNRSFWLAMNSFGPGWGKNGLIKIDQKFTKFFVHVAFPRGVTLLPEEDQESID